jgi:hypothetical protein
MVKTSPENSVSPIYDLEGVPSYDADEQFFDNDSATVEHGVTVTSSEESSAIKPMEVDDGERKATMWSVRFYNCRLECIDVVVGSLILNMPLSSFNVYNRTNEAI